MSRKTRKPKHTGTGNKALAIFIGTACGIAAAPGSFAGPTGGTVTSGQGTISTPTATSTVIDQASSRLSIDWRSFDVAANETVRFNQPNSTAIAVNRILDQKASEVYGRIDANGRVVLINPNGMLFGRTAQVNVGSLLATSLDVVSFDSTTGRLNLAAAGTPGAIINDGSINAAEGGSVSLVGGLVANNGLIVADRGSVNLAAGRSATLDFYGGGLLRFEADSALSQNASGAAAAVSNTGDIYADGGQVLLTTSAARNVFDRAVNNDGVIRASRIDNSGGTIRLVGAGGTVVSSGVLDASGTGTGTGGEVQVLGENVGLFGSSLVDVSGNNGGGVALIGGDYQGANADVINASRTIVSRDSVIRADARDSGDGGKVIFWSDDATQFYGTVTGRGGATSGNGGFMEASSRGILDFDGNVNLGASAGQGGHLLLDPDNITIGGGNPIAGDIDFDDPPAGTAQVTAGSIQTYLSNTGSLTLQANDNINVNTGFDASAAPAGRNFTLQAGENITFANGVIIQTSGNILLRANDSTATGTETGNGAVVFNNAAAGVTSSGGSVTIEGASVQLGNVDADTSITVTASAGGIAQHAGATLDGASIALTAVTNIGQITDLRAGTGNAINIETAGALTADVGNNNGTIHLNFVDVPTLAAGSIELGAVQGGSATGTVLLQAPGDFDVSALTGVVALGTGNTATGALRAGDDLTIATDPGAVFDFTPGTLALRGDRIFDGNLSIDFDVANLIFDSGGQTGSATITGNVGRLTASVGNNNGLTVNVDGAIELVDIDSADTINVFAGSVGNPGDITVGQLDAANNIQLIASDDGAIIDDLNDATTIVGDDLTLNAVSIGSSAANGSIDTNVANLAITATNGDVVIREATGVTVTAFNAAGGALTRLETVNGGLTLNADVRPTTGNVEILVGGANSANYTNRVIGRQGGTGNTLIRTGNNLTVGEVVGTNITLEAGFNQPTGTLTLDSSGPVGIVAATNNVSLTADGAISQAGGTLPSVTGNNLTISAGGNVSLDVDASSLNATVTGGTNTLAIRDANTLTVNSAVAAGTVSLTGTTGLTLQTVNAGSGAAAVNLSSNGAINTIDNTSLVSGSTLTLGGTPTSANLRTNVTSLVGNTVAGALTVVDTAGGLNVSNTTVTGGSALSLTAAGTGANLAMTSVSATTGAVVLQATGAITSTNTLTGTGGLTITGAGSVNLTTNVDTVTATGVAGNLTISEIGNLAAGINAGGLVTLGATGGALTGTVIGNGLNITGAQSANLLMDVGSLSATGVTNDLTVNEAIGSLTVQGVTAGGAVSITAADSILDQDEGTTAGNSISGSSVSLTAANRIGTVSDAELTTGAGFSVDVNTSGILTATVLNAGGGEINLNLVGTPATGSTITLGSNPTGRDGNVLLQSGGNLNLQDLGEGSISIGATNSVGVGYVSGGTLRLRETGSVTDAAPADLLVRGVNIYQGAGTSRTFNFEAGTLSFIASNPTAGADYVLNTDVGTLNATVGNGLGLTVNEANAVELGTISATNFNLQANNVITDDGNEGTAITATNITLESLTNAIGSTAGNGAIDVIIGNNGSLTATSFTGDVAIRSTGTNAFDVDITAGDPVAGNGNIALTAASNLDVIGLRAGGDNISVTTTGSISGDGVITASQLTLANASSVDIDTNVDTLSANNIAGNITIDEASALTLGTVTSNSGAVTLSAGGAITDGPVGTSVTATQLTITNAAGNVDLDTNVNTLNASNVAGSLSIREQAGGLAVTNAAATGAVNVSTVNGSLTGVTASGVGVTLTAGGTASGITITNVNAGAGNVALAAGANGAITDGAGTSVTGSGLTITGAGSVDLGTNVATLAATGITGALAINDVDALSVTNATSNGITLTTNGAGNGLTLGTINAGAGAATLSSGGAISSGANTLTATGGLTIANASSVDLRTDVNTLAVTNNVSGTISVAEQAGSLTVSNATATGAVALSTVNGALTLTNVSGNGVTLTAGGAGSAMTLGTVNAGTGTATLTAGGAVTDAANGATSLTASTAVITAASIGVQEVGTTVDENTLNTAVDTLSATATSGDIVVRDADSIALASLNGAAGQDVIVVAPGDITVTQITGAGPNGAGRVLLAAGSDILANGAGDHITAGNIELRAGGLDPDGGRVGETALPLRLLVPENVGGGADGSGADVPSVLILSRPAAGDSTVASQVPRHLIVDGFNAAEGLLLPGNQPVNDYLTTVFTVRTRNAEGVALDNVNLDLAGDAAVRPDSTAQNSLLDLSNASNAQGEGTLYIDWASFDPNVSLFGTVNPPICLPRDQQEEDDSDAPAAANATSSGCASTTAQQFDGTFRAPTLELVITSRGVEWKPVRASLLKSMKLIAQR